MTNEPRFRPRSILACVAEGALSDNAVRAAVELAKTFGARLDLVHAVPIHPTLGALRGTPEAAAIVADAVEQAREQLVAHLSHAHHGVELGGKRVEELLHLEAGTPTKVVLDRAAEFETDLIVLGDSGRRKQLDFGGAARGLLAKAPCPVWIQTQRPRALERILVPIDLSEHSMEALAAALDLAQQVGARVTALKCFTVREYAYIGIPEGPGYASAPTIDVVRDTARQQFEETIDKVDWRGVDHEAAFVEEDPAHAVLARQYDYDLITMGTHGRTGLTASLLGSVAYQVLRSAHTPVLAIRMAARPWLVS